MTSKQFREYGFVSLLSQVLRNESNKIGEQGGAQTLQVAVPTALTITSGTPLLVGKLAAIAQTSNPPLLQPGTNVALQLPSQGNISVDLAGVFLLTVVASTTESPITGSAVNVGDTIYAAGGTAAGSGSNITYGFTLNKDTGGVTFGSAVSIGGAAGPLIASGETAVIGVRLKEGL